MPSTVRPAAEIIYALFAIATACFVGCSKGELRGLREANRIAEEARREQAEQNTIFAELEATLSEERQAVDRERALAAERHDTAARERSDVLIERRRELADIRRDSALAQALLALAPLGIIGVVVWAVTRAVRLMLQPRPEDTSVAEYLLGQSKFLSERQESRLSDTGGVDASHPEESGSQGHQAIFQTTHDNP